MKYSHFEDSGGLESIQFSDNQCRLVVKPFHKSVGYGPFGPEPFQNWLPVTPAKASDLPHRRDAWAHGDGVPRIEELFGPGRGLMGPPTRKLSLCKDIDHWAESRTGFSAL